jgi:predicted DCC family thiol-disulfide oxidoreductase YuxK
MRAISPKAYSYREDSGVASFDDRGPIVFMDGECTLYTGAARVIARLDKRGEFRICPIQSDLGQAILRHYGLDDGNPDSWIYLADGNAFASLDAVIEAGTRLGGLGRLLLALMALPRPVRDRLYRWIARNRYAIFGRTQMCAMPDAALKRRLLT